MADTIPEDVMEAAKDVAKFALRNVGSISLDMEIRSIARALFSERLAERERTAARLDRLEAAEAERDAARALLKRAGEALEPFAAAANCYDPDENDGDLPVWDFEPKTRELRAIHAEIKEAIDDRS